ncbi:hypothetical protein TNCV_3293731 [Trichonephila clavipes]|nr:hypothetical protein TNCV_3293731 [Trichonephila clavipes]
MRVESWSRFEYGTVSVKSGVRMLPPLKIRNVEGLMYIKTVEAECLHVGVVWKSYGTFDRYPQGAVVLEKLCKQVHGASRQVQIRKHDRAGRVVAYRASTLQVLGSTLGLGKVDSAFHLFSGSINEYQACLGTKTLRVSLQTDHLIETSAHAPQRPMSSSKKHTDLGSYLHPTNTCIGQIQFKGTAPINVSELFLQPESLTTHPEEITCRGFLRTSVAFPKDSHLQPFGLGTRPILSTPRQNSSCLFICRITYTEDPVACKLTKLQSPGSRKGKALTPFRSFFVASLSAAFLKGNFRSPEIFGGTQPRPLRKPFSYFVFLSFPLSHF